METSIAQVPKLWDIRKKDLEILGYNPLENIFYGIHNIEIPKGMLDTLNPDEIIAKFLATGKIKRYNRNFNGIPKDFIDLSKHLDRIAYPFIGNMTKQCKRRFPHTPGEQVKRLESLDKQIQDLFVRSFFKSYIPSKKEDSSNPDAFYDPNIDGRSKTPYINRINTYLKEVYYFTVLF